jgi:hypothetical protein
MKIRERERGIKGKIEGEVVKREALTEMTKNNEMPNWSKGYKRNFVPSLTKVKAKEMQQNCTKLMYF